MRDTTRMWRPGRAGGECRGDGSPLSGVAEAGLGAGIGNDGHRVMPGGTPGWRAGPRGFRWGGRGRPSPWAVSMRVARLLGVGGGRREYGGEVAGDLAGDGGRQVGKEWAGVHGGARLVGDGWVDMVVRYSDFNVISE